MPYVGKGLLHSRRQTLIGCEDEIGATTMTNAHSSSEDAGEALLQSNGQANLSDKVNMDLNDDNGNKASRGRKASASGDSFVRNKEMDEFEHRQRQWYRMVIFDFGVVDVFGGM